MKKNIKISLLTTFLVYVLFSFYQLYITPFSNGKKCATYKDCGIVKSKAEIVSGKEYITAKLYLNVQFEKNGFKSLDVNPTTYLSSIVGEKICFDFICYEDNEFNFHALLGVVFAFLTIILFIIIFFLWLFDIDNVNKKIKNKSLLKD